MIVFSSGTTAIRLEYPTYGRMRSLDRLPSGSWSDILRIGIPMAIPGCPIVISLAAGSVVSEAIYPKSPMVVFMNGIVIGHFQYVVPVATNTRYTLKLHFMEHWFGVQNGGIWGCWKPCV